ncbi:MAG: spore germination protein GerW family protein [Candidatus Aminicenantaceae bacterium]
MKTKQYVIISLAVLLISSGSLWAQAKSPVDEAFISFEKMMSIIKVSSVIGKPLQVGDTVIVPFSKISFGLGAGGIMMGYGGGMGGKAVPLGILIIDGDEVKVELFPLEEKKPSFFQQMLPTLLKMLPQIMGNKSPFAPKPPPTPEKTKVKPGEEGKEGSLQDVKKLFNEKKYEEALGVVDSLIAKDPNDADLHAWKGNIMGSLAQGSPVNMMKFGMGAMQEYEKALELDPKNVMAHFGRGVGRLMAPEGFGGDVNGAIEDLEFACSKGGFADSYYYLGVAYKKKGNLNKAKEAFKKALELKPDYKDAAKELAELK